MKNTFPQKLTTATDAFTLIREKFNIDCEEVWCLALNHQLEIMNLEMIHRGTINYSLFHPRDLFRFLTRENAFQFILFHNHTSQSVQPSKEDIKLTKKILKLSQYIEIKLIDHIIFNHNQYYSFKEKTQLL